MIKAKSKKDRKTKKIKDLSRPRLKAEEIQDPLGTHH